MQELQYLLNMFHVIQNKLPLYNLALQDVLLYTVNGLSSTIYIEPGPNASNDVNYPQIWKN
jgi:hypothetical protein